MSGNRLERFAHNLDWNLLRTFVVLVEEGSITAAANRLLLQQPAVSMALKRLEQTTGHRLINRRPGRFAVTEAGERLHQQAREIFAAVVRLPDQLESAGADISGHVSVHAVSQVHHPGWDARLATFFEQHPKVTMNVHIETTADVITSVERGVATVGLCDGIIPPGLGKLPYKQERYALYCGAGHRLFGVEGAKLNDLRGDPYVAFTADVLGGQHMNAVTAVRAMGSFGQEVRAISSHVEEVIRLVAANVGIGMLPHHLAAPLAVEGKLWQLPPYDTLPVAEVFRITNPSAILNPAETAFLAHMEDLEPFDDNYHHQGN